MAIRWNNIRAELFNLRAKVREMSYAIQQRDDIISGLMNERSEMQDEFLKEATRAAELHIENDKLRNAKRHLESRNTESRNLLVRFARFVNKQADEINVLRYTIDETNKCVDFRKREIAELEVRLESKTNEAAYMSYTIEQMRLTIHTLDKSAELRAAEMQDMQTAIESQATEIARLRDELRSMTDSAIENEVCGIPATFEAMPGVMGFASCGNGCEIKRDEFGRPYEDHEIKCIESDDFDVSLLD